MQPWMISAVIGILILGITYALSSEGAWGAALMFFDVLFAGLVTFNFYEPLATQFMGLGLAGAWADFLASMGIFLVTLIIFRVLTDSIAPGMVRLPKAVYQLGRLLFGLGTACLFMAIMLCILYTAPVDRKVFGMIGFDTKPPFEMGFDRAWLAFFQRCSATNFSTYDEDYAADRPERRDPLGELENVRAFDPRGSWLIDHQNARPYPEGEEDKVPAKSEEAALPAAEPAANASRPAG